jgi:hypothetical protein
MDDCSTLARWVARVRGRAAATTVRALIGRRTGRRQSARCFAGTAPRFDRARPALAPRSPRADHARTGKPERYSVSVTFDGLETYTACGFAIDLVVDRVRTQIELPLHIIRFEPLRR